MASTNPYASLIALATDPTSNDPSLIYDITDRVKSEGSTGAKNVVTALKRRLTFEENGIRRRVLEILSPLIIECGSELHQALIDMQFFVSLANIQDEEFSATLLERIPQWKSEMSDEYHAELDRQLSRRDAGSLISRGVSGLGRFKSTPVHPLAPFLTLAYVRALRILETARRAPVFYQQTLHIARQALHLVIRLNDTVNNSDGPDLEQEQERIDLEDQLMDLEDAMEEWLADGTSDDYKNQLSAIAVQYDTFFSKRFYFENSRDSRTNRIFQKLRAYDEKTLKLKLWRERMGSSAEGDDQSEAFIESVHTSPALSQHREPIAIEKELSLNQVNLSLDPSSQTAVEGSTVASTSKAAETTDEVERAREYRQREAEQGNQERNFTCPVPGCGKSFDKQYLLKHHIREHDDRPYRCLRPGCDRRFTTPTEQRVHEALHRIKNLGIVPNMPAFSAPIAPTSTPAPVAQPTSPVTVAQEVKADNKAEKDEPVPHDEETEPALPPEAFKPAEGASKEGEGSSETQQPSQPAADPPENQPSDAQNPTEPPTEQPMEGGGEGTANP
ncbi:hypothetical protein CPB86DRAFT_748155 [Serendipita vermifera]|nr:hypothetical protein CPB86DRAFT_748155 [Serendipita vermifera]